MEKDKKQTNSKFENEILHSFKNKTNFDSVKHSSFGKNRLVTKNIFLSIPKFNNEEKKNKTFLRNLNLTLHKNRHKLIDSLYQENFTKYENSTDTLPNINKSNIININIIDNDNKNGYNIRRNNKFTVIFENTPLKTNFNTTFKNSIINKFKNPEPIQKKKNKSLERNFKTPHTLFFEKKPSIDYITPIFKNMKTFKFKEEPNLKKINVGELMKKIQKRKNHICLLKDDDNDGKINRTNLKFFKIGNIISSSDKIKNLKERNEFYEKLKLLNNEKGNKLEKKYGLTNNCHELLKFYKNDRFEKCQKLIEQTLLDVKKEKNIIYKFFDNYKKKFDQFDDWNSPKNKDNLYN